MSKRPPAPRSGRSTGNRGDRPAGSAMGERSTPRTDERPTPRTDERPTSRAVVTPRPTRAGSAAQLSASQQRRLGRKPVRRPWWRGPVPLVGLVVLIAVVIGIFIAVSNGGNSSAQIGKTPPASLLSEVTSVPTSVVSTVGTGGLADPIRAISSTPLSSNGKPELLYIGAEFCPHCGVNRWSLINALSRFGTFSNLTYMRSAVSDGDVPTFTFRGSSYTSKYLSFLPIEYEDRNSKQIATLTAQQQQLFSTIGNNGFPFLDFAGKYANGAKGTWAGGFDPSLLSGKDWSTVASALKNANDSMTQAIVGNANYETATICKLTNNQPGSACGTPTIQRIEKQLP